MRASLRTSGRVYPSDASAPNGAVTRLAIKERVPSVRIEEWVVKSQGYRPVPTSFAAVARRTREVGRVGRLRPK